MRNRESKAISDIYTESFPHIEKWIKQNGGDVTDAEDIFQDCLETLYCRMGTEYHLILTCNLSTFISAMARNQWYKKLRRKKKMTVMDREDMIQDVKDLSDDMDKRERMRLYREKFAQLGSDCRKILSMFYAGTRMDEIARAMGFAGAGYAKKKKHVCKEKLVSMIKNDPRYKELNNADI